MDLYIKKIFEIGLYGEIIIMDSIYFICFSYIHIKAPNDIKEIINNYYKNLKSLYKQPELINILKIIPEKLKNIIKKYYQSMKNGIIKFLIYKN